MPLLFEQTPNFSGLPESGFAVFSVEDREARRHAIIETFHPSLKTLGEDLLARLSPPDEDRDQFLGHFYCRDVGCTSTAVAPRPTASRHSSIVCWATAGPAQNNKTVAMMAKVNFTDVSLSARIWRNALIR